MSEKYFAEFIYHLSFIKSYSMDGKMINLIKFRESKIEKFRVNRISVNRKFEPPNFLHPVE